MDTVKFPIYTKHNDFTFVMQLSKSRAIVAQGSDLMPYGAFEVNVDPAIHHYWTELEEGKATEIDRMDFAAKLIGAVEIVKDIYREEAVNAALKIICDGK